MFWEGHLHSYNIFTTFYKNNIYNIIFSLKLFCIAELSLHAEFYILIKFCGGWSTASKEAESPSRGEGGVI